MVKTIRTPTPIPIMIVSYEKLVSGLGEEKDFLPDEVFLLLTDRDAIEDRWQELTAEQRADVNRIDDMLIERIDSVIESRVLTLPCVAAKGPGEWWWFLDEGPQVREQARRSATSHDGPNFPAPAGSMTPLLAKMEAFDRFSRDLGREIASRGLSEEDVLAALQETGQEVFEEKYGQRVSRSS